MLTDVECAAVRKVGAVNVEVAMPSYNVVDAEVFAELCEANTEFHRQEFGRGVTVITMRDRHGAVLEFVDILGFGTIQRQA